MVQYVRHIMYKLYFVEILFLLILWFIIINIFIVRKKNIYIFLDDRKNITRLLIK